IFQFVDEQIENFGARWLRRPQDVRQPFVAEASASCEISWHLPDEIEWWCKLSEIVTCWRKGGLNGPCTLQRTRSLQRTGLLRIGGLQRVPCLIGLGALNGR